MNDKSINEAAVSKAQQKLFGLVKAVKSGNVKASAVSPEVKKIAKDMSTKEIDKFAGTKHKGLPEKKKKKTEESKIETLRNTIREVIKQTLREDMHEFDFEMYDDTDLSGSGIEASIDDLFGQFQESIDTVLSDNPGMKSKARIAIKKMIMNKLKTWN